MIVRQSMLKTWQACPERFRLERDGHPREQGSALVFGTVMHACILVLETEGLKAAQARFKEWWTTPRLLGEIEGKDLTIDFWMPGKDWDKYAKLGRKILKDWASIYEWNTDATLAREYPFNVPIGDGHILHGTIDKLVVRVGVATELVIIDYKTTAPHNEPTYSYLADDLQFTAYAYATLQPEFWEGFSDGDQMYERYRDYPRRGEWVQLQGPKRKDAGHRSQAQYNRLIRAVNQMARSVESDIFVPNISGATCQYCEFRSLCGLPEFERSTK